MNDIEKQMIKLYKSGEREYSRFLNLLGTKKDFIGSGTTRNEILRGITKKHNFTLIHVNRGPTRDEKERTFIDLYMSGVRKIEDYMWHPYFVKWGYEVFLRQVDRMDYRDLIFPTKKEFTRLREEEYKKVVWCRWLFDENDEKIYGMDDIDRMFYIRFGPSGEGSTSILGMEVREWIDNYVRYFGLEGQSEDKIRLAFQRLNNCFGEDHSGELTVFKCYLRRVVEENNIKNFTWSEKHKKTDDKKKEEKSLDDYEQEPTFFDAGEEFEGGDE